MEVSDIRYEVSHHLCLIDTLILFNHKILPRKPSIKEVVIRRLVEMGFDKEEAMEFLEQVHNTNSVISGSFMLAILVSPMDEPLLWKPEDIDVYCFQSDHKQCSFCNKYSSRISLFGEFLCSKGMNGEICCDYPILNITCNRKWKKSDLTINEIIIEKQVDSLRDFIFDTFDFDFCKIAYDGKTLSIKDPTSVLEKHCMYRGDKEALKYFSVKFDDRYYPEYIHKAHFQELIEYNFRMGRLLKT